MAVFLGNFQSTRCVGMELKEQITQRRKGGTRRKEEGKLWKSGCAVEALGGEGRVGVGGGGGCCECGGGVYERRPIGIIDGCFVFDAVVVAWDGGPVDGGAAG